MYAPNARGTELYRTSSGMRRYPTAARLGAEAGTFRKLKLPPTGRPVREKPEVPVLGFMPSLPPEIDRVISDTARGLARSGAARAGISLLRIHPLMRYLELLRILWDLLKPPPGADAGVSPAGWRQVGGCENNGWGAGTMFPGLWYQDGTAPFDAACLYTSYGQRSLLASQEGQIREYASSYGVTFGIVRRYASGNVYFDDRSAFTLDKPAKPLRLYYEPPVELPGVFNPTEVVPQIDPWQAPAPGSPSPRPMPLPWKYVPELPDEAPDGTPVRGPRPITRPSPAPSPVPVPGGLPDVAPVPGVAPGPGTRPAPRPGTIPIPAPWPDPAPRPGAEPGPGPGTGPVKVPSVSVGFERGAEPRVYRSQHFMRPAGHATKERKMVWKHAGTVLSWVNPYTEFCDIVDALYKALPKDLRWQHKLSFWKRGLRTPRCQDKAVLVYDHFDKIDISDAIANLIENEAEDRFWGQLSKRQGRSWRELGRAPPGPGFGVDGVFGVTKTNLG